MNIKDAKTEICNTLKAYHKKDEKGRYVFPLVRQRPILLMGPPGIGKTAIMEQVAKECKVGLVSYTITHHTRQSAVGLPSIRQKTFQGKNVSVTEYTLSEIIASVYTCMEETGHQEGILFIDEINCVSETLAPTMLQFLQNKTFGSHKVPDGWLIVAAGNPPEYNKSVREFDIVTLDRVRKIDLEVNLDVWMEYAWSRQIHGAILSYLNIKKDHFYHVENTLEGKFFVTARGWEDLSEILKSYEEFQIPVTKGLIRQYLQLEETARDFTAYYQLYRKYGTDYDIPKLLSGTLSEEERTERVRLAKNADFEERFTVTGLLLSCINRMFDEYDHLDRELKSLHSYIIAYKTDPEFLPDAEDVTPAAERFRKYLLKAKEDRIQGYDASVDLFRSLFGKDLAERTVRSDSIQTCLESAFHFLEECFGDSQEMVLFVSSLSKSRNAMNFMNQHGCDPYFSFSKILLYRQKEVEIKKACMEELEKEQ